MRQQVSIANAKNAVVRLDEAVGDGERRPSPMFNPKSRKRKSPKRVLALPDLEQAKTAVLNSLTSVSGQRTYEHAIREFVAWYCSESHLAFNRCGASIPDSPRRH